MLDIILANEKLDDIILIIITDLNKESKILNRSIRYNNKNF